MTRRERVARALLQIREEKLAFSIGTTIKLWEEVPQWHNELLDDSDAAIAAYEAALAEEGMIIVPREIDEAEIAAAIKPDFMRWNVYEGYTGEVKEAEWQRMRGIEVRTFARRWRAMIAAWLSESTSPTESSQNPTQDQNG